MPRKNPDDRAAAVALRTLAGRSDRSGTWLVVDDRTHDIARELTARGGEVGSWFRWAGPWSAAAAADAPAGPFDQAVLRLPRARPALRYAAEQIAARLSPGGALWLTGCNDEGIKAAASHLGPWFDDLETLDTKHHARLWWGVRTRAPARDSVHDFLRDVDLELPGGAVRLRAAPGVFAKGRLDDATAMLLRVIADRPDDEAPERVLDLGAGIGVLSAGVRQRWPAATLSAVDIDAVAIAALRAGLPDVDARISDGLSALDDDRHFDLVVSNPPLHGTSNALSFRLLERLVEDAAGHLTPKGRLLLVTQRQRPLERMLQARFKHAASLADDGRFHVWQAIGPT